MGMISFEAGSFFEGLDAEAINTLLDARRWSNGGTPHDVEQAEPSPDSDIDTRTVAVTFFPNKSAQSQRCVELTLPQLAGQIRLKTGPSKEGLPWLKLAIFGDNRSDKNCLRTNDNLEQVTGIEVEHDKGEIAFDTAIAVLRKAEIRALIYTSPSYIPVTKERWRILMPVSENQPPRMREVFVARVNGLFGGKLAGESFVLSQAYLYGCVNDNPAHRVEVIDGDFIDLCDDLDPGAMGKINPTGNGGRPTNGTGHLHGEKVPAAMAHLDPGIGLGRGIEGPPPLSFDAIKPECGWLRHVHDSGGADQSEPLWRDALRCCIFLEDGKNLIHAFSEKHDDYNYDATEAKYDLACKAKEAKDLGWPKCQTIHDDGSTHCKSCPHFAAGGSPLHLGLHQEPAPAADPAPADASFVDPYAEFAGPPFPLEVLPPTLACFVDAEYRNMGVDPSGLAMAALTVVAGATHAETLILAGEGWWEKPILWTFLIGLPSTMKSQAIEKTMKFLARIDYELRKIRKQEYAAWRQAQQGEQKGKIPPPPRLPRRIMMDSTPEKVAEVLSRDPCGSLLVHDELASWFGNFERYNSDSRGFYLKTWNGGTHLKDRVGGGARDEDAEIYIENLALCVLGGIQPEKLIALGDLTSDGLLQRGLPCLMYAAERGDQYHSVAEAEAGYEKLIRSINAAPPEKYLFDQDALAVRDRVKDDLYKLMQIDGFSSALIGAIGKLPGYFARICLVLEVARRHDPANSTFGWTDADSEHARELLEGHGATGLGAGIVGTRVVSRSTAEAAEKIIHQFLLPHIFALYDVVLNGGRDRDMLRSIGDFILTSAKNRLLPSDLTTWIRALRGQPEHKIREWAGRFCAMGWLQAEATRPGVPPKAWLVVAGLREHFAERCRQAETARAAVHAIIKAGSKRRRPGPSVRVVK